MALISRQRILPNELITKIKALGTTFYLRYNCPK